MRKAGPDVDFNNVSTYQCSILFSNMGSINRKSEFRKAENMYKPVSPNEKFTNDPQLSRLKEFWGNNYAHVILTAEAASLPTDPNKLHTDCGLVGRHSSSSNDLSVHARINSSRYIRLLWESDDDRNGHGAIFEVKFGRTSVRAVRESRERSAEELFADLESGASALEGSDLCPTGEPFEPSASCIYDTKKRQLVTRSGLPRQRCCVCHLHHKRAKNSPAAVREFSKTALQQVCHIKVDVIAGDANDAAYKYF